jgi:threonine dehydratase
MHFLSLWGGCGLKSGVIVAAKSIDSSIKVFCAGPAALDETAASLREGTLRGPSDPSSASICDALRVGTGPVCWEHVSSGCDGIITVPNLSTIEAMRFLINELKGR